MIIMHLTRVSKSASIALAGLLACIAYSYSFYCSSQSQPCPMVVNEPHSQRIDRRLAFYAISYVMISSPSFYISSATPCVSYYRSLISVIIQFRSFCFATCSARLAFMSSRIRGGGLQMKLPIYGMDCNRFVSFRRSACVKFCSIDLDCFKDFLPRLALLVDYLRFSATT